MNCDQCEMLSINDVPCHETGCPNAHARYDKASEQWIRQRTCFHCGFDVDYDDPCCDAEPEEYSECDEVADSFVTPMRRITFDEALEIVNTEIPEESHTVRSNIADTLTRRSRELFSR